jgi:hypothetical protein
VGRAGASVLFILLFSLGCGYVGPVMPPSPQVPLPITNLTAVERGDKLVIQFSTPGYTTDTLEIQSFSDIDLGIGPATSPVNVSSWAEAAKHYALPAQSSDTPPGSSVTKELPIAEWQGQDIAVGVRTAIKGRSHSSQWSNLISLKVVDPLQKPTLQSTATPQGYKLTCSEGREGLQHEIFRQGPTDKTAVSIGVADKNEFVDTTSQWDTPYKYFAVAKLGAAESVPSDTVSVQHQDTFPPSVPANLAALAGPDTIELTWTRSPESDLKGYRVYRSIGAAPFEPIGELTNLPTYSDRKVEHGKTYRYAISAIDQKNNESDKSATADVTF